MVASGENVASSDVLRALNRRIATASGVDVDGASGTFATESVVDTVTAAVVSGRTYRVRWTFHVLGAGTNLLYNRLRLTNTSGTQLTYAQVPVSTTNMVTQTIEADWTAGSTGNQVFVGTGFRQSGASNTQFRGATSQPRSLIVEYAYG